MPAATTTESTDGTGPTVGFIGLGTIGLPMATRLRAAGFPLRFVARRPEVVEAASALGGVRAGTPEELGEISDVVVVCVFDDRQLEEVVLADDGALAGMRPGSVLVSHTTGSPRTLERIADAAAERGVQVLDATFSGGAHDIGAGTLTVLVGGDEEVLARVRPVLEAYAEPIIPVGGVGDGQRVKLLNNAVLAANIGLLAEAERVADELGIDPTSAFGAMAECSGQSFALGVVARSGSAQATRQVVGPYLRKDVGSVRAVAEEAGVDLGLLGAAADLSYEGA